MEVSCQYISVYNPQRQSYRSKFLNALVTVPGMERAHFKIWYNQTYYQDKPSATGKKHGPPKFITAEK
jgi:hypothetical protein